MPEEINRVVADQLSNLLFCPSDTAVENLRNEGITKGVLITGDVMYDALQFAVSKTKKPSKIFDSLNLQPKNYLLATVHRAENTDDPKRLINIMNALSKLAESEVIVLPLHPRTKKILEKSFFITKTPSTINPEHRTLNFEHSSLKIIDPVGYFDMIALEKSARMILTDSGGIQKEAYWLKVPCITLRDETEWVETVEGGWNILTGADKQKIINTVQYFKTPTEHPALYSDGYALDKIINTLLERNLLQHD
jgi:UDP-N-acetylglucosamine 2-epimerase